MSICQNGVTQVVMSLIIKSGLHTYFYAECGPGGCCDHISLRVLRQNCAAQWSDLSKVDQKQHLHEENISKYAIHEREFKNYIGKQTA